MPDRSFDVVIDINSRNGGSGLLDARAQIAAINGEAERLNVNTQGYIDLVAASTREEAAHTAELAQQAAIESQIQVIAATRLELVAAATTGTEAQVKLLQSDLGIRSATLGVMRAQTLSAAELNALTEQEATLLAAAAVETAGVAEGSLLAGVNLSKARQEALVLSRELAVGNVRASTLGSLMGSFGTTISIAAIAGYELYHIITKASEASLEVAKNVEKQTAELLKAVTEWITLAKTAQSLGDEVKLADKIQIELDKAAVELAKFRLEQLGFFKNTWDEIVKLFGESIPGGHAGTRPFQDEATENLRKAQERYNQTVLDGNIALDDAKKKVEGWAKAEADLPAGITLYTQKVEEAQAKLDAAEKAAQANPNDGGLLEARGKALAELNQYKAALNQLGDELDKVNNKGKQHSTLLREISTDLADIRRNQQLISQDPYLDANAKQVQLHNLYLKEQLQIEKDIATVTAQIALLQKLGNPQDQAQIQQLIEKLHQLGFTLDGLKIKEKETTAGGEFTADLAKWVNSFGTAAHQIAATIEGTINASLQGTNQLLLDSIFKTGDWRQTLQGVERQILNLFLTFIEQQAEQAAAQLLHITAGTTAQVASGAAITAAHAPAAAATSISSYGYAAVIGEVLAIAAIAAIMAALGGGFAQGGYTRGRRGQVAGLVHGEEYVWNAEDVDSAGGVQAMETLRASVTSGTVMRPAGIGDSAGVMNPGGGLGHDTYQWTGDRGVGPILPPQIGSAGPGDKGGIGGLGHDTYQVIGDGPGAVRPRGRANWRKYHEGGAIVGYTAYGTPLTQAMINDAINNKLDPYSLPPEYFVPPGVASTASTTTSPIDYGSDSLPPPADYSGSTGPGESSWIYEPLGPDGAMMVLDSQTGAIAGFVMSDGSYASYGDVMASGDPTLTSIGDQAQAEYDLFRSTVWMADAPPADSSTMSAAEFEAALAATYGFRGEGTDPTTSSITLPSDPSDPYGSIKGVAPGTTAEFHVSPHGTYGMPGSASMPIDALGMYAGSHIGFEAMRFNTGYESTGPSQFGGFGTDTPNPHTMWKHSGGPIGPGDLGYDAQFLLPDEVPIIAQVGEHVIQSEAVDYYGGHPVIDLINNMRIPVDRFHYHEGGGIGDLGHDANPFTGDGTGFIGGQNPVLHQAFFFDKKKAQQFLNDKRGGKKQLIDLLGQIGMTG